MIEFSSGREKKKSVSAWDSPRWFDSRGRRSCSSRSSRGRQAFFRHPMPPATPPRLSLTSSIVSANYPLFPPKYWLCAEWSSICRAPRMAPGICRYPESGPRLRGGSPQFSVRCSARWPCQPWAAGRESHAALPAPTRDIETSPWVLTPGGEPLGCAKVSKQISVP